MNIKKLLTLFNYVLPGIIMFSIGYYAVSPHFLHIDHSMFILSLLLLFPLLAFVQGIVTALLNSKIILSIGFTATAFLFILILWLNNSAWIYFFVYIIIGFAIFSLVRWMRRKKR